MTLISDLMNTIECLNCRYRSNGKDFIYKMVEKNAYIKTEQGMQLMAKKNEDWAYHCPKCDNPLALIYFK